MHEPNVDVVAQDKVKWWMQNLKKTWLDNNFSTPKILLHKTVHKHIYTFSLFYRQVIPHCIMRIKETTYKQYDT